MTAGGILRGIALIAFGAFTGYFFPLAVPKAPPNSAFSKVTRPPAILSNTEVSHSKEKPVGDNTSTWSGQDSETFELKVNAVEWFAYIGYGPLDHNGILNADFFKLFADGSGRDAALITLLQKLATECAEMEREHAEYYLTDDGEVRGLYIPRLEVDDKKTRLIRD